LPRAHASRFQAAIALAVAVTLAGCGSEMQPAHSRTATTTTAATTTAATTATGTTTAATSTGPVRIARLVALARRSLPGLGDSTVTYASVVTTTKKAAENWLEPGSVPATGASPQAYVIVLHGRFVCQSCTRPSGARATRGSSVQLVWVPGAGVTDFGLTPRVPTGLPHLGRVVRIYLGRLLPTHVMPSPPIRPVPAPVLRAHPVTPSRVIAATPRGMMNGTPAR
jgi:hypothetical protein